MESQVNEFAPYAAIIISGLTLVLIVIEKLFGGGTALANKFHELERVTNVSIAEVRKELINKVDNYESQSSVGFEAMRSGVTEMRIALSEFRATVAEQLHAYIRKDDYNAGISDIKRDVAEGFRGVGERIGQLQELILHQSTESTKREQAG